jgi:predicted nucleotidyltransferase
LLEAAGFDVELAGAELLGRDVASICKTQVLDQIWSVVISEANRELLARRIVQTTLYEARPALERPWVDSVQDFCA